MSSEQTMKLLSVFVRYPWVVQLQLSEMFCRHNVRLMTEVRHGVQIHKEGSVIACKHRVLA
jgi:hypothetical protein